MSKAIWIQENLKAGEKYAGILLGKDGAPDHHLILLSGQATGATWEASKKFAADAGGELPTRREQALLFANLKEEFEPRYYWSCEHNAPTPGCAWVQHFHDGNQHDGLKSFEGRARAVRRLVIF